MKLLLSPRISEDSIAIRDAAIKAGWEVVRLQGWRTEAIADVGAIYGETLWARAIAGQVGRQLIEPPLTWLMNVPWELLRRDLHFGPAKLMRHTVPPISFPAFIKPADDKSFEARVYDSMPEIHPDTEILISELTIMLMEFRVWVLNGKAVTGSLYRHDDSIEPDVAANHLSQALWAAERCARSPNTPPALVIDVARTINGTWVAVEANPCFGSGIYQADPNEVLKVLSAACVDEAPERFCQPVGIG